MAKLLTALCWVFGVFFFLFGIISLVQSVAIAMIFFAISALLLPSFRRAVYAKTQIKIPTLLRVGAILLLLVIFGNLVPAHNTLQQDAAPSAKVETVKPMPEVVPEPAPEVVESTLVEVAKAVENNAVTAVAAEVLTQDQAFHRIVELVEAGISMEPLRERNLGQCANAMERNQKQVADLRALISAMPERSYGVSFGSANLQRCVSCVPNAILTCGEILDLLNKEIAL